MTHSIRNPQSAIRNGLSRRDWLRLSSAGVVSYSLSGWMKALADGTAAHPQRRKACILLWMDGGPSQTDTFALKPGHRNGGQFKEIETAVPGIKISEHLPKIARFMDKMAIIRSMDTRENDHPPGAYLLHTGNVQRGPIQHPTLGSIVARELGSPEAALPNFVSIAPAREVSPEAYRAGFLGPKYAPLVVGETSYYARQNARDYEKVLQVQDLALPPGVADQRFDARIELLKDLQKDFLDQRPGVTATSHQTAYDRAVTLMRTAAQKAFNLDDEAPRVRDAYGRNLFGQGCLLARRLVEQGVPFVEVTLGSLPGLDNWDTHNHVFDTVKGLSGALDAGWSQLMTDLKERGMLDSTLIVWAGEFGRTPGLPSGRPGGGRDHWATGWSTVLAGGGIKGGQVIGKTSADGMKIEDRPITAPTFVATITKALGIDPTTMHMSNVGRPVPIVEKTARPIAELVG